jgi:hypothetical protein
MSRWNPQTFDRSQPCPRFNPRKKTNIRKCPTTAKPGTDIGTSEGKPTHKEAATTSGSIKWTTLSGDAEDLHLKAIRFD